MSKSAQGRELIELFPSKKILQRKRAAFVVPGIVNDNGIAGGSQLLNVIQRDHVIAVIRNPREFRGNRVV